jgi:uncharacterized protein YbbC (DUF1343 family)
MKQLTRIRGRLQRLSVLVLALAAGCAAPPPATNGQDAGAPGQASAPPEARPAAPVVRPGIDVLLAGGAAPLLGKRVGLITNHTGLTASGESTADRLARHPGLQLVALFGPEHGIRGQAAGGEKIPSGRDPATGLPVYSLYGDTRKPTPEMLRGIDVLVFDIQDIGARYYTYVWTMALAMEAAAEHNIPFVVLDRPNPIGGELVQGNVLDPKHRSFVGLYPVPMRHGMTAGELARWINDEHRLGVDLTVVPAEGWRRDLWYDETGLPWVPPSPNMPSVEAATHYPGTCLFEATNLSVGRGTPRAFEQIGAPWLDHVTLAQRMDDYGFPGVRFEPVTFTPINPDDRKYPGQLVRGIRFIVTDRSSYDPTIVAVAAMVEIQRLHPGRFVIHGALDRLAGTDELRKQILAGASVEEITAPWAAQIAAFRRTRDEYLLYP